MSRLASLLAALALTLSFAACSTDDSAGATVDGAEEVTDSATETTEAGAEATDTEEATDESSTEAADPDAMPISGELTYEGAALEAGSTLVISVNDLTKADATAALLAQETIELEDGASPISFAITVPRAELDKNLRYSLRAQVYDAAGEPLLTTNSTNSIEVEVEANELGTLELVSAT